MTRPAKASGKSYRFRYDEWKKRGKAMSTSRLVAVMFGVHFIHVVQLSLIPWDQCDFVAKVILVGVAVAVVIASYLMGEKKGHDQVLMECHREMIKRHCPK
jgi:hypothetical protein